MDIRLTDEELAPEIDYMAHEIVVPITGKPSNAYEEDAIAKYKRDLRVWVTKLLDAQFSKLASMKMEEVLLTPEEMDVAYCLADLSVDKLGHKAIAKATLNKAAVWCQVQIEQAKKEGYSQGVKDRLGLEDALVEEMRSYKVKLHSQIEQERQKIGTDLKGIAQEAGLSADFWQYLESLRQGKEATGDG